MSNLVSMSIKFLDWTLPLNTKYRSVENLAGAPASTSTSTASSKKVNPARARRSKLRQEEFMKKKMAENREKELNGEQNGESQAAPDAGDTSSKPNQLLVNLRQTGEMPMETRLNSPIPQVDGIGGHREQLKEEDHYSFLSGYGEEDILFSLEEVFPPEKVAVMLSSVRVAPLSADHLCNVTLRPVQGKKTSWPVLGPNNVDVFRDIKKM